MSHKGYVLLIVLIFMQVFALLGIYALTLVSLSIKENEHWLHRETSLSAAKQALREAEQLILQETPNCIIPPMSPSNIKQQPTSWWFQYGCSGIFNKIRYYYVLESLTSDACAFIDKFDNNQRLIADYDRVTLYYADLILQSTLVKPIQPVSTCQGSPHSVTIGRQMWRQL